MHVVFVEPHFPANQREFVRALHQIGVRVTGIGESPFSSFDEDLRRWLYHYEQVPSVVNEEAVVKTVRWIQERMPVDRIEATVEAHILSTARVREACGIAGTSLQTAWLCRDKPTMKEVLRQADIPCAQSTGTASMDEARAFAEQVGYPLILKPRSGAGASGTYKVDNPEEFEQALVASGLSRGANIAIEEFIDGHEGFYDTIAVDGEPVHEFVTHYYPNVLEAMRTRWISPQFITTNRIDAQGYDEVKEMGRRVIAALGIGSSATHMEWFYGSKGLKFSEIGCRPPGVRAWDLYGAANEMDLYVEWALAVCFGKRSQAASRRFAAGIVTLRPDRDGRIARYEGLEAIQRAFGEWIVDYHLPPVGHGTQPVEAGYMANAWVRMRHPDYDELRRMLDAVGETVKVRAE